jgi:putative sterol carrier protein
MPKTTVKCPNCKQPITADIDQLFDVNQDPGAKQRLLSGIGNFVQCPLCGYQGNLATPIVYHDPEKELLLTYMPPELGLPRNEQEKVIGNLINETVKNLPQEKRKGYLFQPQAFLTKQSLVEKVLEADGITREMIDAQQNRLKFVQRLVEITDESVFKEVIKQEDAMIDQELFELLNQLIQVSMSSGDQNSAKALSNLQNNLVALSTYGQKLTAESQEVREIISELQALGDNLTHDKILDMVIKAETDTKVRALVSLVRPIIDYEFFAKLSDRIDRARGDGRVRLTDLRTKLLDYTDEVDKQIEEHVAVTKKNLEKILELDDSEIDQVMKQYLQAVDEYFLHEVDQQQKEARQKGDLAKSAKLQKILDFIEKANTPPPQFELVKEYLAVPDEQARQKFLEEHDQQIDQDFMDMLANLVMQSQSGENQPLNERVMEANRQALRYTMSRSMKA